MYPGLNVRCYLFLSDLNENTIFWTEFQKQISDLIKILPVGTELFLADGQLDRQTYERTDSYL
jgi:hypothetical protein